MTGQPFRNAAGGLLDRNAKLRFSFDGRELQGYAGDTLASALLANGVSLVGRSFKYHRARGIMAAGAEEPNALVRIGRGNRAEPNLKATQVELRDRLEAESQNRWPNLRFDVGQVTGWFSRFLPAGFYYKTFMGPGRRWMFYEPFIRRAAGLGTSAVEPDPDIYALRHAHCDVLVAGAGPAGLAAALEAARAGARVVLIEEQPRVGGRLLATRAVVDGKEGVDWADAAMAELEASDNVRVLTRTTAFGYFDHNLIGALERVTDHWTTTSTDIPRHRRWMIRAKQVVLTTGALERPMVFGGNDRSGVMLASAAQTYANQYAVRCGTRTVLMTNNDAAYRVLPELRDAGIGLEAVLDVRAEGPGAEQRETLASLGLDCLAGVGVVDTVGLGSGRVRAVRVAELDGNGRARRGTIRSLDCDLLLNSGGWNPTVHLFSQSTAKVRYEPQIGSFVPGDAVQATLSAGGCNGELTLAEGLASGHRAGREAARACGIKVGRAGKAPVADEQPLGDMAAMWLVEQPEGWHHKAFVDFQNDVTAADVALAARENYRSVEHLKRYTTLGMGTDQGRTSNVNGLAILAASLGQPVESVGHTTFRPPYSPISLGALAGPATGHHLAPTRYTPLHDWHVSRGASFVTAGLWLRPQYYQRKGETPRQAWEREALHVRAAVGLVDVSTLGKIMVQGTDAAEFLERVYINRWKSLKVGRCRYGIMLREDGFVMDDGTTTRVSDNAFYMTTTTASAGPVMTHLEYHADVVWPELDVHLSSVSDQWAGMALAGPKAREVLAAAVEGADVSDQALPFMGFVEASVDGRPVWVFRMTFSGEMAYEIHCGSDDAVAVWEAVMAAGEPHDIAPYGTEAMGILRIEKGHVVGAELDGRTTAADFGFDAMMRKDSDFIGRRALERPALAPEGRRELVGLKPVDGRSVIPRGGHLVAAADGRTIVGHVTSQTVSPNVGSPIGLAMLEEGRAKWGSTLYAVAPLDDRRVAVEIGSPVFIDPEGERPRG